jgi:septal ring factor EnvC (AmiA/AmiB activator)
MDVARVLVALSLAACAIGVSQMASAQSNAEREEARKRLEGERGRLQATQKREKDLQSERDKIAAERARIDARLVETAKLIMQSEAQLTQMEARLGELEAQEKHLRGALEARHGSISTLLAALQRMGRNPPPVMVTRREDALTMVRSAMLLASAFPELRGQAVALSEQLGDLLRVKQAIRDEGEKLRTEAGRLSDARLRLAGVQEEKRQSLAARQAELTQVRQAANEIAKSVTNLNDLLVRLDKELNERAAPPSQERQQTAAAPPQPPVPPAASAKGAPSETPAKGGPGPVAGAAEEPGASVVLAPSSDRVAMIRPGGGIAPQIPFTEAKGLLPMPAQGRRVIKFGDKTQYGRQSQGLVLETRHGGQVVSPCDGRIVYAGEFRSYGQLLIINAGGGYHILLAGLSQIDVQMGQFVLAGEPVGVMAPAAKSAEGKAQGNAPVLYIEFRKNQEPIDPDPWWTDASRKVQG